jgi:S1-C subfamily serine protease
MKTTKLIIIIISMFCGSLFSQEPQDVGAVKIITPDGSLGTAFAVSNPKENLYLFATAYHVVSSEKDTVNMSPVFKLEFNKDLKVFANVSTYDKDSDLAVLWAKVPEKVKVLELTNIYDKLEENSTEYHPSNKRLEAKFMGYAEGEWKITSGLVTIKNRGYLYSDGIVIPGQSGGPMIVNGKIAGVVSGGSIWLDSEEKKPMTWPTRCGSSNKLVDLIDQAKKVVK